MVIGIVLCETIPIFLWEREDTEDFCPEKILKKLSEKFLGNIGKRSGKLHGKKRFLVA